jgi:hypothetical protein
MRTPPTFAGRSSRQSQVSWRAEGVSGHFNAAHSLLADNSKSQAYSALRMQCWGGDERGHFGQGPAEGEDWPFVSDVNREMAVMRTERERKS